MIWNHGDVATLPISFDATTVTLLILIIIISIPTIIIITTITTSIIITYTTISTTSPLSPPPSSSSSSMPLPPRPPSCTATTLASLHSLPTTIEQTSILNKSHFLLITLTPLLIFSNLLLSIFSTITTTTNITTTTIITTTTNTTTTIITTTAALFLSTIVIAASEKMFIYQSLLERTAKTSTSPHSRGTLTHRLLENLRKCLHHQQHRRRRHHHHHHQNRSCHHHHHQHHADFSTQQQRHENVASSNPFLFSPSFCSEKLFATESTLTRSTKTALTVGLMRPIIKMMATVPEMAKKNQKQTKMVRSGSTGMIMIFIISVIVIITSLFHSASSFPTPDEDEAQTVFPSANAVLSSICKSRCFNDHHHHHHRDDDDDHHHHLHRRLQHQQQDLIKLCSLPCSKGLEDFRSDLKFCQNLCQDPLCTESCKFLEAASSTLTTPSSMPPCPLAQYCMLECHGNESYELHRPEYDDDDDDDDDGGGEGGKKKEEEKSENDDDDNPTATTVATTKGTRPPTSTKSLYIVANRDDGKLDGSCVKKCCKRLTEDDFPRPTASANFSHVTIRWSATNYTKSSKNDFTEHGNASAILFHIEKKVQGDSTNWTHIAETFDQSYADYDVQPEISYEYRLWATSSTSFLGISGPCPAVSLEIAPGPPENLTEGDTLISEGSVSVFVSWSPPRYSPLAVTKYNVIWNKRMPSSSGSSPSRPTSVIRRSVPSNQLSIELPDLEQDASYFVQVQAVSQFGNKKLKGAKSSIVVTTYPIPFDAFLPEPSKQKNLHQSTPPAPSRRRHHHHQLTNKQRLQQHYVQVTNLTLGRPFYDESNLKVILQWDYVNVTSQSKTSLNATSHPFLVTWYPDACIVDDSSNKSKHRNFLSNTLSLVTENKSTILHSLRVDCRYTVKVEDGQRRNNNNNHQHSYSQRHHQQQQDEATVEHTSTFANNADADDWIYEEYEYNDDDGGHTSSSSSSSSSSNQMSFATPSCGSTRHGHEKTNQFCINTDVLLPKKVPKLEYKFLIVGSSSVTCQITWSVPQSQSTIMGYRVSWLPSGAFTPQINTNSDNVLYNRHHNPVFRDGDVQNGGIGGADDDEDDESLYKSLFEDDENEEDGDIHGDDNDEEDEDLGDHMRLRSVFLDHSATSLSIGNLNEATTYLLRIQAVSLQGPGKSSYIHLTTPSLQTVPVRWKGNPGRKDAIQRQSSTTSGPRSKSVVRISSSLTSSSSSSSSSSSPSSSSSSLFFLSFIGVLHSIIHLYTRFQVL